MKYWFLNLIIVKKPFHKANIINRFVIIVYYIKLAIVHKNGINSYSIINIRLNIEKISLVTLPFLVPLVTFRENEWTVQPLQMM